MSDGPKFKAADEEAFFVCPCFKEYPKEANEREEALANMVFSAARAILGSRDMCLNRSILILLKCVAKMMKYVPQKDRRRFESQMHDMLDHEMAHYPSRD